MPSPFPGMDPYLEHAAFFPDLHHRLIVHLQEAIQAMLPEPYYVKTNERGWIERPTRSVLPDVNISRKNSPKPTDIASSVAVLDETTLDTEVVEIAAGYEEREIGLEIRSGRRGHTAQLVTAIELLSPSNKAAGSDGRSAYLGKQLELLASEVHLIEIDLLRGGTHTTAIPRDVLKRPFDYHIAVRDRNLPPTRRYSYPIQLEDRLPKIVVPLLPGDGYVTVELQPVFDRCYDTGSHRREIDYRSERPDPPLSEAHALWAQRLIEQWLASPPASPQLP